MAMTDFMKMKVRITHKFLMNISTNSFDFIMNVLIESNRVQVIADPFSSKIAPQNYKIISENIQ